MNVKESHIVTGMSRDSSVSQHNPNLVYDAHNIRITTKDGSNSMLSVVNERGTKQVPIAVGGDTITGTPLGSTALGNYIVIFTHQLGTVTDGVETRIANCDHIYRCTISSNGAGVKKIFEGDANFDLKYPIEALPVYETEELQKVYWVDGKNQPRVINIVRDSVETNADKLNFSREIVLKHDPIKVEKTNGGGLFPTGTIQYMFSYYDTNGQETRLIDVSPMFYLSPKEKGARADQTTQCSFTITFNNLDTSFNFIRVYSIVRTQENATPSARLLGSYPCKTKVVVTDNGAIGSTIDASSLYFIGGEECIAGTIAQKDNTLFLGDITLTRPNLIDIPYGGQTLGDIQGSLSIGTIANEWHFYCRESTSGQDKAPQSNNEYYDYSIDNNRSSYYIKRFKHGEYYRLGFIAQYKNGQWSDPLWIDDKLQNLWPMVGQDYYQTGKFVAEITGAVAVALKDAGYRRLAPVVVYPTALERNVIAQGIVCPTVFQTKDRQENAPYAQSSWFYRYSTYANSGNRLADANHPAGEIQCQMKRFQAASEDDFYVDGNIVTFNSPEFDCVGDINDLDLSDNLELHLIGTALSHKQRIVEHFISVENAGINEDICQVISIRKNLLNNTRHDYFTHNYPLYCDSPVDNNNTDEVVAMNANRAVGWIVYPWHRQGSLNNQKMLSTKQKQNGFTTRTALLKRNITATVWFTTAQYDGTYTTKNIGVPSLYNSDQLSAVRVRSIDGTKSYNYYGNVDKVITPSGTNTYPIFHGWWCDKSQLSTKSIAKRSEEAITIGYNSTANTNWNNYFDDIDQQQHMNSNDPVPMKYKSSPHLVMACDTIAGTGDANNPTFVLAELARKNNTHVRTNASNIYNFQWIRCGDSVDIDDVINGSTKGKLHYLQGDCYVQRYDCLKTYPFTNEDLNSVIEIFSILLESYVNLDFRTDSNRGGTNNYVINPTNFNLFNHAAYEQSGNFFVYHSLDPSIARTNRFPNVVTWSLEKHFGEDVDSWASVDISNTLDLDGAMGNLTKLINYNNDIYAFQSTGFARLLFNSRVQIPTSDNNPIEITNGMKMDGKKYISTKVGCTNKWSIIETPLGLYFNDDILRATYLFNGQLTDVSTDKGMKSWMNESCNTNVWNPYDFANCRAFYDKVGRDIYWVYGGITNVALVYSEVLGQYMSFMDYGGVPLIENAGNSTFAALTVINNTPTGGQTAKVYVQGDPQQDGHIVFTSAAVPKPMVLEVRVMEPNDQSTHPAAEVGISGAISGSSPIISIDVTIFSSDLDERDPNFRKFTFGEIVTELNTLLAGYFTVTLDDDLTSSGVLSTFDDHWLDFTEGPFNFDATIAPEAVSPFWELGTGEYNMFFGQYKPYWLTFISNSYPTENKIFNTVAWRDIVKDAFIDKPFTTFDHIEVWNEHQNTGIVRFTNSLKELSEKQPVSYDAAQSNLRKKFNVWRCQIPRDKLATNSGRARISNPWCYIKLSRSDINTYRHEFTGMEVDFFI